VGIAKRWLPAGTALFQAASSLRLAAGLSLDTVKRLEAFRLYYGDTVGGLNVQMLV
jgi:hypothetical protein